MTCDAHVQHHQAHLDFVQFTALLLTFDDLVGLQPVAVGIVLFGALLAWILPCGWGAKDWFRGEKHNLEEPSVR